MPLPNSNEPVVVDIQTKVLFRLRDDPSDQIMLCRDFNGITIRRMWINKEGQAKVTTLPVNPWELDKLVLYINSSEEWKKISKGVY